MSRKCEDCKHCGVTAGEPFCWWQVETLPPPFAMQSEAIATWSRAAETCPQYKEIE